MFTEIKVHVKYNFTCLECFIFIAANIGTSNTCDTSNTYDAYDTHDTLDINMIHLFQAKEY